MNKISKRDLITLKKAVKHTSLCKSIGIDRLERCFNCPMSNRHNRLSIPCYAFIRELGGNNIYKESGGNDSGCELQMIAINYMIEHSKYRHECKI